MIRYDVFIDDLARKLQSIEETYVKGSWDNDQTCWEATDKIPKH